LSSEGEKLNSLLKKAESLSEEAKTRDYKMPIILPFTPAILTAAGAFIALLGVALSFSAHHAGAPLLTIGAAISLAGVLINFYVIYKWISRRNEHFARSLSFYETVVEIADVLKFKRAFSMKSRLNELKEASSGEKNAVLDTILTLIPFYIFYVYHYLNKDFYKHSEKEKLLMSDLFDELREKIPTFTRRAEEFRTVPERSTFLYVILTILFGGFFLIYWVYTLAADPNNHFESHMLMEREILSSLKELVPKE